MITLIEALNFRCFKYIRQPLGPFHVLVGPNASGKSTFFDALSFLFDFVNDDLDTAIKRRGKNFYDLVWNRIESFFELAIEVELPTNLLSDEYDTVRYELRIRLDTERNETIIDSEQMYWKVKYTNFECDAYQFIVPKSILSNDLERRKYRIIRPRIYEDDVIDPSQEFAEIELPLKSSTVGILRQYKESVLRASNKKAMGEEFLWLKRFFAQGLRKYEIDSEKLKMESSPGSGIKLNTDGSNLPWVIEYFKQKYPNQFLDWVHHLQTALPDLMDVSAEQYPSTKEGYTVLIYNNNLIVPSWCVSEGTLRLIALTLIVYLPDNNYVYLIEEPENGIHPQAIETIMQSLQSIYDGQVFITTHSPLILNMVKLDQILCFTKDENGVHIVNGKDHPILKEWRNEVSLGTLFASGVMG